MRNRRQVNEIQLPDDEDIVKKEEFNEYLEEEEAVEENEFSEESEAPQESSEEVFEEIAEEIVEELNQEEAEDSGLNPISLADLNKRNKE